MSDTPIPMPDEELPDELPESFTGSKRMLMHVRYGNGGGGLYRWCGRDGREWPIQEQYDTRKPKPATAKKPAFEPNKTGVVIVDPTQPSGFYGEVCGSYRELRETWKRWRAERMAAAGVRAVAPGDRLQPGHMLTDNESKAAIRALVNAPPLTCGVPPSEGMSNGN